jgi:phosphoglycolate phosphatase-like HAD superfamily hydrolase
MTVRSTLRAAVPRGLLLSVLLGAAVAAQQPLPSWNDGAARSRIIEFVRAVTDSGAPTFVPVAERIAVFDNDGTLWSEKPMYFQVVFMLEELKAQAPKHPEWKQNPVFEALVHHDHEALARMGHKPILALLSEANAGMNTTEYDKSIREWLATAKHPRFRRPYTDLVFVPMQEVLAYFRANGFKTFIVSGGSAEFMRTFAEAKYGVPPEQVIGTYFSVKYEANGEGPQLERLPKLEFLDDGPGKPVGIYRGIGRRPIAAFGNSDGDLEMLQYTTIDNGTRPRLGVIIHHTDAEREWKYDRDSKVGKLDKALDAAKGNGWVVVDMKNDWKRIYAFDER